MKKDAYTLSLLVITIIMISFVFLIAKHYKTEVKKLDERVKKLEIFIKKE
jgi:preprotein translocase subunit YajC